MPKRKILFLDFDGVLHGEQDAHFARLAQFQDCLMKMPEVEVVISSSWRELHPFAELKSLFDPSFQDRIVGITPSLECGYEAGGRQCEIEAFLNAAGLNATNATWIALDDMDYFFDKECAGLILVNPTHGFKGGR
jgi:hypothetical protein